MCSDVFVCVSVYVWVFVWMYVCVIVSCIHVWVCIHMPIHAWKLEESSGCFPLPIILKQGLFLNLELVLSWVGGKLANPSNLFVSSSTK